jgi:hypothetical protein
LKKPVQSYVQAFFCSGDVIFGELVISG